MVHPEPQPSVQADAHSGESEGALASATAVRVYSFAESPSLGGVLQAVSSRQWLEPSRYSPDRAIAELHGQALPIFRDVGFPDIRSHRKPPGRYDPYYPDPSYWNRMISWRATGDRQQADEPIASVRCMGLSPEAVARRADRYESQILSLAIEHKVSASLIKAVITEESCFNKSAVSPVGAIGLMQLMPDTATWLKVKDPQNPAENLAAGVRYLASLRERFQTLDLTLAAYNAGPGNVRKFNGIPPFPETQSYVTKVMGHYRRYVVATRLASRQGVE